MAGFFSNDSTSKQYNTSVSDQAQLNQRSRVVQGQSKAALGGGKLADIGSAITDFFTGKVTLGSKAKLTVNYSPSIPAPASNAPVSTPPIVITAQPMMPAEARNTATLPDGNKVKAPGVLDNVKSLYVVDGKFQWVPIGITAAVIVGALFLWKRFVR